jgi:hypothetical protein
MHSRFVALRLENVGFSTSENPMGLHGLLQGSFYCCYFYFQHVRVKKALLLCAVLYVFN